MKPDESERLYHDATSKSELVELWSLQEIADDKRA